MLIQIFFPPFAYAADGSGTATATPGTVLASSTENTVTVVYTASETMNSGEARLTVPTGWTAPQGSAGSAGYTTVSTTGTLAKVEDTADSATGWAAGTACASGAPSADSTTKHEGTASVSCANGAESNGDRWYKNISSENWSTFNNVGFWIYSSGAITANHLLFAYDDAANLASPIETISVGALSAATWTYVNLSFGATTRIAVVSYGFQINNASGVDNKTVKVDDILLGPYSTVAFAGQAASVRLLNLASSQTVTFVYGDGGGTSGANAPATLGAHTFTVANRVIDSSASLGDIASSPTVDVVPAATKVLVGLEGQTVNGSAITSGSCPTPVGGLTVTIAGTATTQTANTAFTVCVYATDNSNNFASLATNNTSITSNPNDTQGTYPSAANLVNGKGTFSLTLKTATSYTVTATPTGLTAGTSSSITIQPAAASTFVVTTQNGGTETANTPFSVTLTAKDAYNNTVSSGANNYTGSKTINWTWTATSSPNDNVAPTKPADGSQTFTNGVATISGFTLTDASETPTITATDPDAPNPAGTSAAITANPGDTNKLVITTWPASVNVNVETTQYIVQRRDAVGNPTTSSTQQVDLTSNSTGTYQFRDTSGDGSVTFVTIGVGVSTENFFYIDDTAGSWTISVAFTGLTGDSKGLTVINPAKFWLKLPGQTFTDGVGVTGTATVTANQSFSVTIYKTDGSDVLDTSYTGSHTINWIWDATSSPNDNVAPTKPADGTQTFSGGSVTVSGFTLTDASETPTITATEPSGPTGDSSAITVNPGLTTKLVITTNPTSTTAGVETAQYIVERRDAVGNPTTSGTQQVDLSSTSTGGAKQFRDSSGGGGVTFVTIANSASTENFFYYDEKSGSWTISVSATGLTGDDEALTVNPDSVATFTVTTQNSGTEVAGTSFSVTLTAKDSFNNTVSSGPNNYTGSHTINWTWTATNSPNDTAPTKPADGAQTFTNGVLTLAGFTLTDSGETPTITGTDPDSPNPVGTSSAITVRPAAADSFTVTTQNGGTETANVSFSVTLTAKDSFGNTVSSGPNNYTGSKTINWTWTATSSPNDGVSPTKPANGARTFTNGVLTLGGFILTDASETPTITGTDPNSPNPAGTSAAITVNPGSTTKLVITTNPASVTAGSETTEYIVQRRDAVGNPTTSGGQTVNLSSTSTGSAKQFRDTSGGGGVSSVTITNGNSTENFFYYDEKSGSWTISVAAIGKTGDSKALTVNPDATDSLAITTVPASTEAGSESGAFVVQRRDQFGNATTSGTQQVDLSSNSTGIYEFRDASGGAAVAFVTVGAGVSTENFFYLDDTAGTWTISVSFIGLTGDSEPFTVIELAAPSGFGGTALSTTSIRWTWTDNSSTEDGFRLYSGVGDLIAPLAANAVSYNETGLTPDTSYTRYVRAFKGLAESSASNSAAVKTKASPAEEEEEEAAPPAEEEVVPPPVEEEEEEEVVPPAEEEEVTPPAPSLWEQFIAWAKGFWQDVTELANAFSLQIAESFQTLAQDFVNALVYIYNGGLGLATELNNQVKTAVGAGIQIIQQAGENLAKLSAGVGSAAQKLTEQVGNSAQGFIAAVVRYTQAIRGTQGLIASGIGKTLNGLLDWIVVNIADGGRTVTDAVSEISDGFGRVLLGLDKFREIVFETEPNHISNVKVTAISSTEVEISWETNHLSTSQVNYGSAVGTYEFTAFSGEQTREHTMVITGLNSGATYNYELISKNRDYAVDAFRSFTTPSK